MKRFICISILFINVLFLNAQNIPGVLWSKRFGGNSNDVIERIVPAGDAGWLVFGNTASSTGDVGTFQGGIDTWITFWDKQGRLKWKKNVGFVNVDNFVDVVYENGVFYILCSVTYSPYHEIYLVKMNLNGTILSQQFFEGGADDIPVKLLKCSDGYVILAKTTSTELPFHHGGTDVYALKFKDSSNLITVQWNKCLGGTGTDEVFGGTIDDNGNILIVSESTSSDGDVGNHHAGGDMWVISLSPTGVINWQKCYGGSGNEFYGDILKTSDNNLVVACRSPSLDGDVTGLHYGGLYTPDAWVFKIDISSGNIIWKNCFGGSGTEAVYGISEQNTEIYVAATTATNNNGNVTGYNGGASDIWVFKLSSTGNLIWQRCLGGTKDETFTTSGQPVPSKKNAIITDTQGGCVLLGYSTSLNGNVTGYHGTSQSTAKDVWAVRLDSSGIIKWQRCFGGTLAEQNGDILQINADDYIFGFSSTSSDGDISGNYGGQDAWLARFGPACFIKGSIYVDANYNSVRDANEILYPLPIRVESIKQQDTTIASTSTGLFTIDRDTGVYKTQVLLDLPYLISVPDYYVNTFATHFTMDSINFGLQPVFGIYDLVAKIIPLSPARPGFAMSFLIVYSNVGTEPLTNVMLKVQKDGKLNFLNASPVHSSIDDDTIYWNLGTLQPFEGVKVIQINCTVKNPPITQNGDIIKLISSFGTTETDQTQQNNNDTLQMRLQGAFDPNDIIESHGGELLVSESRNGEELNYVIRYQNTGTDTAFNILIRDTVNIGKLDWSSFKMTYSSHPYQVQSDEGKIIWKFNNINLPDSNRNKSGSKGLISFSITPKNYLSLGDVIQNSASIYFDFNLPIQTNNALTEIVSDIALPLTLLSFKGVYKNDITELYWSTTNEYNIQKFEIERSFNGINYNSVGSRNAQNSNNNVSRYQFTDNLKDINEILIYYRLKMIDIDGKINYSNVILVKRDKQFTSEIQVLPNPVTNHYAQVMITSATNTNSIVRVIDANGKIILLQYEKLYVGINSISVKGVSELSSGIYLLQVIRNDHPVSVKFIIK